MLKFSISLVPATCNLIKDNKECDSFSKKQFLKKNMLVFSST